jgi:hypothetical protein
VPRALQTHALVVAIAVDDQLGFHAEDTGAAGADHHIFGAVPCHAEQAEFALEAVSLPALGNLLAVPLPILLFIFFAFVIREEVGGLSLCVL